MFTLPQVREKMGAWDESKHRRGQPKNAGQFASGGGGRGGSAHQAAHASFANGLGILSPSASAKQKPGEVKPPPLPGHQQAAMAQLFGGAAPSRPPEHDANYKPDNPLRAPGTGKPPANLGSPKSVDEARDQLIWLLGRSTIIRQQGREMGRATPEMARELTLNINLASRLQHGFFKLPDKSAEPMTGPKVQEQKKEPAPEPKKEAPKPEPAAPIDIRHNPLLDEAFAAPPEPKPTKPEGDLRANPLLESLFGESKPTPKPDVRPASPAPTKRSRTRRPEGAPTHGVKLPRERTNLTVQHAAQAVHEMGYSLGPGKHDLKRHVTTYELTHHTGAKTTVTAEQLKEMIYRGKKKTPRKKPAAKSFHLPPL